MREVKTLCWAWLLFSFLLIVGMVGAVENGDHANWFQIAMIVMSWVPCYRMAKKEQPCKKHDCSSGGSENLQKNSSTTTIIAGSDRECNDQRFRALIAQTGR